MASLQEVPVKRCTQCGRDVTYATRYKINGRYWCEDCRDAAPVAGDAAAPASTASSALPTPTAASTTVEPPAAPTPVAAADDTVAGTENLPVWRRLAGTRFGARARVVCPHCWHAFAPEDVLWESRHADLVGDPVLGRDAALRFLPSRFTVEGLAIDARGMTCHATACPRCHLSMPRGTIEAEPLFVSMIGVPSSGKSYLLTSMVWGLRQLLPTKFAITFLDADPTVNRSLNEYEETLFLPADADEPVALRKTETEGELYDQVRLGEQVLNLPRPFLFSIKPQTRHPNTARAIELSRVLCLYDNAGEHFLPGSDTTATPVTQHLARARGLMFLFDPMQDPRFRQAVQTKCGIGMERSTISRQETVLVEAARRVRTLLGLPSQAKHAAPLVVVLPKLDAWGCLLDTPLGGEPYAFKGGEVAGVDVAKIEAVSAALRKLLVAHVPELVAAAEDFSAQVLYVPVSAIGCAAGVDPVTGRAGVRPRDVKPVWATVPLMYLLAKYTKGLIGQVARRPGGKASA